MGIVTRLIVLIVFSVGFALGAIPAHLMGCKAEVFFGELRGPLFTGFLTMGSFLLSVTTWIIVRLHEGMYKSAAYVRRFEQHKHLGPKRVGHILDPLSNLSDFLIWSVLGCLATAVVQLLAASHVTHASATIALGFVGGALALVAASWWAIRRNLHDYFECLRGNDPPVA